MFYKGAIAPLGDCWQSSYLFFFAIFTFNPPVYQVEISRVLRWLFDYFVYAAKLHNVSDITKLFSFIFDNISPARHSYYRFTLDGISLICYMMLMSSYILLLSFFLSSS